jgi:DHA2 family multidrug resistance protein
MNLCRNIGGSVGISMVTTLIARRTQLHQDTFATHLSNYDGALSGMRQALSLNLSQAGYSTPAAAHQATGLIYGLVQQQAAALAYIDTLRVLGIACLCMLPLVLLMGKNDPHKAMTAH